MLLGDKLAENIAQERRLREAEEEKRKRKALEQELARKVKMQCILDNLKSDIIEYITEGHIEIRIKMSNALRYFYDGRYISMNYQDHPDSDLWVKMVDWATSENLSLKILTDHDGVGVDSWFVLEVTPKITKN